MDSRHPLGQLIKQTQDARGWSDRDLERRVDGRYGLGKSNLSKLKNHPIISIKGETIRGLAWLLVLPEERVAEAALQSMNIRTGNPPPMTLDEAIRAEPSITDRDKRLLLSILNEMLMPK